MYLFSSGMLRVDLSYNHPGRELAVAGEPARLPLRVPSAGAAARRGPSRKFRGVALADSRGDVEAPFGVPGESSGTPGQTGWA